MKWLIRVARRIERFRAFIRLSRSGRLPCPAVISSLKRNAITGISKSDNTL
jgi:hypothetical protein